MTMPIMAGAGRVELASVILEGLSEEVGIESKGLGTVVLELGDKIESVDGSDASGVDVEVALLNTELESTDVVILGIVIVVVVGTGALIVVAKRVMVTVVVIVVLPPLPYEV